MAVTLNKTAGPGWASGLGAVVVLLGVLLAAWHGNEWMKLAIVGVPPWSLAQMPDADCEADELEEEGLTLAECRQLALSMHDISISAPDWFPAFHIAVSAAGLLLALLSVFAGVALVDYRQWAAATALTTLGALAVLDVVSFVGVVMVGPLIRQMYLWSILLWFFIHLSMAVAALAGYRNEREARRSWHAPE
ncbi:MAG TPA: hypothetical protein VHG33_02820 [Woeseiaceae bacterium]|nr:hypothetical protein [Woeseiaceae bacterium]